MKIQTIEVRGLNKQLTGIFYLHPDINVVTGLNGSGKTTLLKVMWYLISGNIERISREIRFDLIKIETDLFTVTLNNTSGQWQYISRDNVIQTGILEEENPRARNIVGPDVEVLNRLVVSGNTSSLYFPTFRRIEGGYSMTNPLAAARHSGSPVHRSNSPQQEAVLREFEQLASRMSVYQHRFVVSISTLDLASMLTQRYATISEELNAEYKKFTTSILGSIRGAKSEGFPDLANQSETILNSIKMRADEINDRQDSILRPFAILSELTAKLFRHKGISLRAVTLGEAAEAIDSGALSAGEKQMLSFLCYNAFNQNAVIFIDEPELSLHPDWQRRLFGILLKQEPTNQFIVATHSPFVYTKFEDKEIALQEEKGE